jgi:OOP family OmpA-OmpF porin
MKKIAAIAWLSTAISLPAFAADQGFYVGVDAGSANVTAPTSFSGQVGKTTDTSLGILVGYHLDKNWGIEAQYLTAGEIDTVSGANFANVKSDVYSLDLVLTAPVADQFSLYGKAGGAYDKADLSSASANYSARTRNMLTFGLGGQYDVSANVGIRLGWDRYFAAFGDNSGNVYNYYSDVYSLAAIYKF